MMDLTLGSLVLLSTSESSQSPDTTNSVLLELLGIFLIFCCVLYLAYIASRFVGKKFSAAGTAKHIQVIEQISIGLDKQLLLIRVGSEHYLFVSSKKELKMVAKVGIDDNVDVEDSTQNEEVSEENFDFRHIFDKYLNSNVKQMKKKKTHTDLSDLDKPLKENIHRLQQMQGKRDEDKEVQSTCEEKEES